MSLRNSWKALRADARMRRSRRARVGTIFGRLGESSIARTAKRCEASTSSTGLPSEVLGPVLLQ